MRTKVSSLSLSQTYKQCWKSSDAMVLYRRRMASNAPKYAATIISSPRFLSEQGEERELT